MRHPVKMNYLGPNPSDTVMQIYRLSSLLGTSITGPIIIIVDAEYSIHNASKIHTVQGKKIKKDEPVRILLAEYIAGDVIGLMGAI